ncbi:MAG: hypothetical protein C0448_16205, partial [Sphingobacteriaceae bacterium]|nr:hypothetical protein [Sphingobacteriaceae bacterium]
GGSTKRGMFKSAQDVSKSAMNSGIHINPHCGPHNFKLRTHIGIVTPPEAVIRVGSIIKPWVVGKCIVFDDSFEHEVWNKSNITRIVFIVDVWNPNLTVEEIKALEYIMPEYYQRAEI